MVKFGSRLNQDQCQKPMEPVPAVAVRLGGYISGKKKGTILNYLKRGKIPIYKDKGDSLGG
jgi:hypothetical protein